MKKDSTTPKILSYLRDKGAEGCNIQEFRRDVSQTTYAYHKLCMLTQSGQVSKITDRWYIGNPKEYLDLIPKGYVLPIPDKTNDVIDALVSVPNSINIENGIDLEKLQRKAEEGLALYLIWLSYSNQQLGEVRQPRSPNTATPIVRQMIMKFAEVKQ